MWYLSVGVWYLYVDVWHLSVDMWGVVPLSLVLALLLRRHGAASQPALPQVGGGVPERVHHPRLLIVDEDLTVLEAHATVVKQGTSHTETHTHTHTYTTQKDTHATHSILIMLD